MSLSLWCSSTGSKPGLVGMYFQNTGAQLRRELVFMLLFNRVEAKLIGMYFKSIRIQLLCEHVFMMLFNNVRAELMGLYIKTIRIQIRSELVFISSSKTRKLNSWTCFFKSISNSIAMWTHGACISNPIGSAYALDLSRWGSSLANLIQTESEREAEEHLRQRICRCR